MRKGIFITFEGIDGTGKSTQAKLLKRSLIKRNYKVKFIDFPQHSTASSLCVDKYLRGEYGKPEEVGPYRASILFAVDRYDASFKIKKWLNRGYIIISDRYIGSNIGHQGGKIKNKKERDKYIKWLFDLEYNIFKIPKPDITFLLDMPWEISHHLLSNIRDKQKIKKKVSYLRRRKKDILEKNQKLQKMARIAYLETAKKYPKMFKIITCYKENKPLSPPEIHRLIYSIVKTKFLN